MVNLMRRYRVTTRAALVRAIRDNYTAETCEPGERPVSLATAEVLLDRLLEAEYQRIAGGVYDRPIERLELSYEQMQDPDPERFFPRDPIEVYGTPEHEAWLLEMERREG
jgi:hypothetical protein